MPGLLLPRTGRRVRAPDRLRLQIREAAMMTHHDHQHSHDHVHTSGSETDPVCGMSVDPATAKGGSHRHDGKTYSFCNPRCRDKFIADPGKYLSPRPEAAPVAAAEWTCPMHPEIVRDQPGSCPICGMAL